MPRAYKSNLPRLIAAAPEMLSALKLAATKLSIAASYITWADTGIADAFEAEANKIRDFIACIEGEDQ